MEPRTVFPVMSGTAPGGGGTVDPFASVPTSTDAQDAAVQALLTASRTYLYNGATWDRIRSTGNNADALATIALGVPYSAATLRAFNGATWDRVKSAGDDTDALATISAGVLYTASTLRGFNGATWDRVRSAGNDADALATIAAGVPYSAATLRAFNGTTWDRIRANSAAAISATTQPFAQMVATPGQWSANHTPAANTQATISKAAGAAGVRHVCTSVAAAFNALAAAAETTVLVNLRDGATGAGTILWSLRLHAIPAGTTGIALSGLAIFGTAATAMTLEFAAAGGANTFESVSMTGYSTI